MSVPFRPLGLVKEMLTRLGLETTYVYDDLVFVSHNAMLLQFGERGEDVGLFINRDCPGKDAADLTANAIAAAAAVGLTLTPKGNYALTPNEDETLSVAFV